VPVIDGTHTHTSEDSMFTKGEQVWPGERRADGEACTLRQARSYVEQADTWENTLNARS
jgi:hypothetical protein